jgi:hypothetical protein
MQPEMKGDIILELVLTTFKGRGERKEGEDLSFFTSFVSLVGERLLMLKSNVKDSVTNGKVTGNKHH